MRATLLARGGMADFPETAEAKLVVIGKAAHLQMDPAAIV